VLNDNLVVKLPDYLSNEPILSFLGDKQVLETISILLEQAKTEGLEQALKLIPEVNLKKEKTTIEQKFSLQEDLDNNDYILSVKKIVFLEGKNFKSKRRMINKIKADLEIKTKLIHLQNKKIQQEIKDLFYLWEKNKKKKQSETKTEPIALKRLMKSAHFFNLISLGFYKKDKLIAFTINEIIYNKYYMGHFGKADSTLGLSKYIEYKTARVLSEFGCQYMNFQQDLGIFGLRKSKKGWQPVRYLKKYILKKKKT
jgi:hypothetical protein